MPLTAGQSLSFYEIIGPLGAGAMGEVYRARDTRLERDVALKVLPEELAGDEERLRRFEREAKTLASLNHPNVAQVFGIDQVGDTCFMAMELVPGEDLAARLSRGALPVDEVLDVCQQIAEGVEAAHEAGVIHRDLKPANVVITPEGKVKVLDFGLAKPAGDGAGGSSTTDSALTTEEGRLLGTPTYMAPEQARGKPIDKRVDVWAFGCVLYECLTGRRAFAGETMGDVLAAVLERNPDWSAPPSSTPSRLRELLERCLRKDPQRRLRDVGDARILLEELGSGTLPLSAEAEDPRGGRRLLPLLAVTTIAATAAAVWFWQSGAGGGRPRLVAVNPLATSPVWTASVSWSPRGESIAYAEMTKRGLDIFVKPTVGGTPDLRVSTPGDDVGARYSPDGRTLAFVTSSQPGFPVCLIDAQGDGQARLLIETGQPGLVLAQACYSLGDRPWSLDGSALLVTLAGSDERSAIHRVDVETGQKEQLTFPAAGEEDFAASLSFDGERIVFHRSANGGGDLWMMPASGGEPTPLLVDQPASYTPAWRPDDRRVVFIRSTRGGYYDLWEIDTETHELRQITFETRRIWNCSVAEDDRIGFASAEHDTFLHSVGRSGGGELTRINAHSGDNFGPRPAPDGVSVAYHSNRTGNPEIWLVNLVDGRESQLTDNPAADLYPDWSPSGEEIVFVSNENGPFQVFVLDVERRTRRLLVDKSLSVHGSNLINASIFARWSPGKEDSKIAFIVSGDGGYTLWTVRPDGSELQKVLDDVYGFDWYLDSRRGLLTRQRDDYETDLIAVNLVTGESRVLATIAHTELDVAPDGTAVSFCSGPGHMSMEVYLLELAPPSDPDGLPTAMGEPVRRTDGEGHAHAHNGGWMPDSQALVFTLDEDYGDVFEIIEQQ